MSTIADLERSLQRHWDVQTLGVYADALVAAGDSRGELIAIDLAIADGDSSAELLNRREALARKWRMTNMRPFLGRPKLRFGFVEDLTISSLDGVTRIHESKASEFLRSINVLATAQALSTILADLAARPMPWLRRLSIHQTDVGPLERAVAEAFAIAAPNLDELNLDGEQVMLSPGHPNVSSMRLLGTSAIIVGAKPMPNVTAIELAFDCHGSVRRVGPSDRVRCAGLLNPRTFANLRTLDLARNEFVYPTKLADNVGVFPFLDALEMQHRITHLRLPSLRSKEDAAAVLALLKRVPTRTIEIARLYAGWESFAGQLDDPRLTLPAPRPWPSPDTVAGREALTVKLPQREYGDDVALASWIEMLERNFDNFAPETKSAWLQLWSFLDDLGWETADGENIVKPFPAATLLTALEVTDIDDHRSPALREALQALTSDELAKTNVSIKRYWGW